MKRVKRKYKNKIYSSPIIKRFNTNDIEDNMILFYEKNGFTFLFEEVKPKVKKGNKKEIIFDVDVTDVKVKANLKKRSKK